MFSLKWQDLNTTEIFAPVIDTFLTDEKAFLGRDPIVAYLRGDFHRMRVITGVAESEGAAMFSKIHLVIKIIQLEMNNVQLWGQVENTGMQVTIEG